jgi:hypothetical protein
MTERTARWFLDSGIQAPSGGVGRYYRTDTQQAKAVSSEITGYAAAALVHFYRLSGDPRCLEAARRAGRFLARVAWNRILGAIPFEMEPPGLSLAYFFDTGIIARGLAALWRSTGEAEFLEVAAGCAESMARDFRIPSGYAAVLALPEKTPLAGDGRWSRHPGCYQLKSAMAWLEVAEAAGTPALVSLYEDALSDVLKTHAAFLDSESDAERRMDRLHAYCYFLEGLLPRAAEAECAAALAEGIGRVARLLDEIGSRFERCDVWAQLLRLRLYADALGVESLDRERAQTEAGRVRGFQLEHEDPRIDGAFSFGRRAGAPLPFANPVSTIFSIQALQMWEERQSGVFSPSTRDLI